MPADTDPHDDQQKLSRPRVVVSVTASVDGRVALNRSTTLMDPVAARVWRSLQPAGTEALLAQRQSWIESRHGLQVVLEGSGTFVPDTAGPPDPLPPTDTAIDVLLQSYLPEATGGRWFVVVDGRGRIRWSHKGDDSVRLLVLVCHSTPPAYLSYLRREQIPYLVAGTERVDLATALSLLQLQLGASCVISEAGGGLNGALLRAGLVDELHLVLLPALIGGRGTPTIFDGPPLRRGEAVDALRLLEVRTSPSGALWLHYETEASSTPQAQRLPG